MKLRIEVVPIDARVASLARIANQQYGRRMSHALAKASGEPPLFKGNDFSQTDIEPALRS